MMRRIERDWLRRVPGYQEGEGPEVERIRRAPAGDEEGAPGPAGDEEEGGEQDAARQDPPDGEENGEQGGETSEAASTDDKGGPPENGKPGGGGNEAERRDAEPPGLSIPDEIEDARLEREEPDHHKERGERNQALAPKAFGLEGRYLRGLAARFARMVSKVAEDSADLPTQGDDEWDLVELARRRFTGRLIAQCRMTREKRKVAVVLDTSPSCEQQARLFAAVARVAEELGDCDLYDAPNFAIHSRRLTGEWEPLPDAEQEWNFQGRVVLAFGDFDGIQRISAASAVRGNKIYWFCCEERPTVLENEREYFLEHFKGRYLPAINLQGLMNAMRKVR